MLKPIPWPLVLVPPCTGSLDLIEERKVQRLQTLPKWGEGFPEKRSFVRNEVPHDPKQLFHIGNILAFVNAPTKE